MQINVIHMRDCLKVKTLSRLYSKSKFRPTAPAFADFNKSFSRMVFIPNKVVEVSLIKSVRIREANFLYFLI